MIVSTIFFIVPIVVALWIIAEVRPWPRSARLGFGFAMLITVTGAYLIYDEDRSTYVDTERSIQISNTRLAINCLEQEKEAQLLSALKTFLDHIEAYEGVHYASEKMNFELRTTLGVRPDWRH